MLKIQRARYLSQSSFIPIPLVYSFAELLAMKISILFALVCGALALLPVEAKVKGEVRTHGPRCMQLAFVSVSVNPDCSRVLPSATTTEICRRKVARAVTRAVTRATTAVAAATTQTLILALVVDASVTR